MLKKMLRKKETVKSIWLTLTVVIILSFVLWGSGSFIRNKQGPQYAVKVFGKKISSAEFKDALEAVRSQAIIQFGDNFSDIQKYMDMESQAWERLILLAEAKKRKIQATDKEITDFIASYPLFQRKGKFDNKLYNQIIQYVFRTQPRIFEEQTRQNLILAKLYDTITKELKLADEEIKAAYRKENEKISAYYIAAIFSEIAKTVEPKEEDLKDYFAKNSIEFKQPLSFNIEYALTDSADKAGELIGRLNKKEDFAKLAKENNLAIKETGLFAQTDPIPGIGWAPQILSLISKAKTAEFLQAAYMDKHYILRIKERKEPFIPDYETVKDKIKGVFITSSSKKIAKEKSAECLKKLKETYLANPKDADFEKTAKDYGLKFGLADSFGYGSYIEGIGASDNFWTAAKDLKEGGFSEIIDLPSGFYIIKLKSITPIDEKKFEAEKEDFAKNLLAQKKEETFRNFLTGLKDKSQ